MEEFKKTGIELTPKQNQLFKGIRTNTLSIVHGPAGTAKAQPLDTPILTPDGWVTMGDINVGDMVISVDGTPTKVTGTFPQGEKDIWELTFSDGTSTQCCSDHLWHTQTHKDRVHRTWTESGYHKQTPLAGTVKSTLDIVQSLYTKKGRPNHSIPLTEPVNFHHKDIPDPYESGKALSAENFVATLITPPLVGKHIEKKIPTELLYNTVKNRIELLHGLMANGGTNEKDDNTVLFNTSSLTLSTDVVELVQSLGGVATVHPPIKKGDVTIYRVKILLDTVSPFRTEPDGVQIKTDTPKRFIVSAKLIGKKEAKCIMVEHPSHLYLTNDYIVTHNTFMACYSALYLLANKEVERIILTKPIKESGEELGFLPGTVAEKVEPFMKSYISNFEKIIGPQATSFLLSTGEITIEPLAYMRGSTYDWSVMLLDEAQNSTLTQLMLWSTRLGKESRMVLMGDTSQYDVREKDSGLRTFIDMTDGMDGLLNFEFSNQDIVRNKFLIELTDRYDKHRFKK
jgi:phosphate starvation-inducible protein PhoH